LCTQSPSNTVTSIPIGSAILLMRFRTDSRIQFRVHPLCLLAVQRVRIGLAPPICHMRFVQFASFVGVFEYSQVGGSLTRPAHIDDVTRGGALHHVGPQMW